MLELLSESELKEIYSGNLISDSVKKVVEISNKEGMDFSILQDHAFGTFWKRKLESSTGLNDSQINEILARHSNNFDVWSLLGEAAKRKKISIQQAKNLLVRKEITEWAKKQINALIEISMLENKSDVNKLVLLHIFLQNKTYWAIIYLLEFLDTDQLKKALEKITSESQITKSNKNWLIQEVNKRIKNMVL